MVRALIIFILAAIISPHEALAEDPVNWEDPNLQSDNPLPVNFRSADIKLRECTDCNYRQMGEIPRVKEAAEKLSEGDQLLGVDKKFRVTFLSLNDDGRAQFVDAVRLLQKGNRTGADILEKLGFDPIYFPILKRLRADWKIKDIDSAILRINVRF